MKLTGTEDLRVQKTVEAIHGAFEQMLMEMAYRKITVKKLCERARINKKTFYRYYPTLDHLLAEFQDEYSAPYIERMKNLHFPEDLEKITRGFLSYSAAQGELYDRITCSTAYADIRQKMIDDVIGDQTTENRTPKGWNPHEWKLYCSFALSAPLKFYQSWVEDGRKVPLERMVELGCAFICHGALHLPIGENDD